MKRMVAYMVGLGLGAAVLTWLGIWFGVQWIAEPLEPHSPEFWSKLRYWTVFGSLLVGGGTAAFTQLHFKHRPVLERESPHLYRQRQAS